MDALGCVQRGGREEASRSTGFLEKVVSELDPEGFWGGGGFEQTVTGRKDVLRWGSSLSRGLEAGMGQVISAPWVWLGCQVLQAGETFAAIQVGTDEGQNWSIDSQHPSVYHTVL